MIVGSTSDTSINVNNIFNKISKADILGYYLGITTIPTIIQVPWRNDKHPSLGIKVLPNGDIYYTDFSTMEKGDAIGLLCKTWGCSRIEACKKIQKDLLCINSKVSINNKLNVQPVNVRNNINTELKVVIRDWTADDFKYWESYGVDKYWLNVCNVYPISKKIIIKDGKPNVFGADKYAYVFVEKKDNKVELKIYQPFNKNGYKWHSAMDKSVWSLWSILPPEGDTVIISSSLKDCLNIMSNFNIPSVCLQGEKYLPKESVMEELKRRFKNVIVFYDNDFDKENNPGREASIRLCEMYGLKRIEIPSDYKAKDPSDLYKKLGREIYFSVIQRLLTNVLQS